MKEKIKKKYLEWGLVIFLAFIVLSFFFTFRKNIKEYEEAISELSSPVSQETQFILEFKPKLKTEEVREPEPINLSGLGQQASQKFSLEKGLSIFRMAHSGQNNFAIKLLDNNGQYVELLVNEIGSFNGAKAVGIESKGIYLLDISADGQWSVKIEQPRPSTAQSIPKTFTGKGQQVSEVFNLNKGLIIFKMTHDGSDNFAIKLLDKNGGYVELLVNEIGSFDGSKAVGIEKAGIYLLDISADGNWSINIE